MGGITIIIMNSNGHNREIGLEFDRDMCFFLVTLRIISYYLSKDELSEIGVSQNINEIQKNKRHHVYIK